MADILEAAAQRLGEQYAGPNVPLESTFTDLLLDIGVDLIQRCMGGGVSPESLAEKARNPNRRDSLMVRRLVAQRLRDEGGLGSFRRLDGDKIVASLFAAAANSPPEEMRQFWQEVNEL